MSNNSNVPPLNKKTLPDFVEQLSKELEPWEELQIQVNKEFVRTLGVKRLDVPTPDHRLEGIYFNRGLTSVNHIDRLLREYESNIKSYVNNTGKKIKNVPEFAIIKAFLGWERVNKEKLQEALDILYEKLYGHYEK